jgi:hypothetical protein
MSTSGAVRAGRAFVEIALEGLERFKGGMKQASDQIRIFGFAAQGAGRAMMSLGASIAGPLIFAIKAASDFRESMNRFDIVFGSASEAAKKWGNATANVMGRAKSNTLEYMTDIRAMLNEDFSDAGAAAITEKLLQAGLDYASVANETDQQVVRAISKALTNAPDSLKEMGINVQDDEMKAYAKTIGQTWSKMSLMNKQLMRTELIIKRLAHAEGDVVKTSDELAGVLKQLQGDFKDAAVEVGDALIPAMTRLLNAFKPVAQWFGRVGAMSPEVIVLVGKLAAGLVLTGIALQAVGMAAQALSFVMFALSGSMVILKLGVAGLVLLNSMLAGSFSWATLATNIWGFTTLAWGSLIAVLTAPLTILIGVVIGLTVAMLKWGGNLKGLAKDGMTYFGNLTDTWSHMFDGIMANLVNGDLKEAAKVMWLGLELAWLKGIEPLRAAWQGLMDDMKFMGKDTLKWIDTNVPKGTGTFMDFLHIPNVAKDLMGDLGFELPEGKRDARSESINRIYELDKLIADSIKAAKDLAEKRKKERENPKDPDDLPGYGPNSGKGKGGANAFGTFNSAIAAMMGGNGPGDAELKELKEIALTTKRAELLQKQQEKWMKMIQSNGIKIRGSSWTI